MDQMHVEIPKNDAASSRAGVTVLTWGSQNADINQQYLPSVVSHLNHIFLKNHNPGHTAVQLAISDTPQNREMVSTLLAGTNIVYKLKTYNTPTINFPMNSKSIIDGAFDNHLVHSESVIEIYFSFWPASDNSARFSGYQSDLIDERLGVHVQYDIDTIHRFNPELNPERRNRNTRELNNFFSPTEKEITLEFNSYFHQNKNNAQLNAVVQAYQEKKRIAAMDSSANVLLEKLKNIISVLKDKVQKNQEIEAFSMHYRKMMLQIIGVNLTEEIKIILNKEKISLVESEKITECLENAILNIKNDENWAKLQFIHSVFEYLKHNPMTLEEKKTDEKVLLFKYFRECISRAEKSLNFAEVNKVIVYFKERHDDSEINLIKSNEDLQVLKKLISEMLSYLNPNSLVNQNIRVKLEDMFGSNQLHMNLVQIALELKAIFLNKEFFKTTIGKYFERLVNLSTEELFEAHEGLFLNVLKKLHECFEILNTGQDLAKDHILNIEEAILQTLSACLMGIHKRSELFNDEMIYDLSNESYIVGKQPDHTLSLPIKTFIKDGLDPVAMLKQMAKIAHDKDKQGFNLISYNCSSASMQVLAAGAGNKEWIFNQGELGTVFTPHIVYMRTREYLNELNNPYYEKPTPYFVAYKNCLDHYGNRAVSIAAKKDEIVKQSWGDIIKSGAEMIYSGGIAIALQTVGSVIFNQQKNLDDEATDVLKRKPNYNHMTKEERTRAQKRIRYNT